MTTTSEGTVYISRTEFCSWIIKQTKLKGKEVVFGIPRLNIETGEIQIDYAQSDKEHPSSWSEKSKAVLENEKFE